MISERLSVKLFPETLIILGYIKMCSCVFSYHKNVASNIKQVLAATSHKASAIRPPASHHKKLYKLDEPETQDTTVEAKTNSSVIYTYGPLHMAKKKQDDKLEHTYSSYMRIRDVAQKACQKR